MRKIIIAGSATFYKEALELKQEFDKAVVILNEYFNYLIEIPELTAASIAQTIRKVAGMPVPERRELGEESRNFILARKNKNVQAQRIIDFVER